MAVAVRQVLGCKRSSGANSGFLGKLRCGLDLVRGFSQSDAHPSWFIDQAITKSDRFGEVASDEPENVE